MSHNVDFEEEWRKMLSGEVYEASDRQFLERLVRTKKILKEFNSLSPDNMEEQHRLLRSLLGKTGGRFHFNQPFRCDYGCNISIGENFFANFELTILDEAQVTIGDNVFIGPNVSIYTACHPVEPERRRSGVQWAEPVTIGNDVWIGGGTIILPGVTVGDGTTIGAGSVVSRSIPPRSLAVGSPCRVIRTL